MSGAEMLTTAAAVLAERRMAYGDPCRSMELLVKRWSLTLGQPITAAQVAMCLIDLKLTRLSHDPAHQDSILDIAGYAAVLHEVAT
jgi:hypothetical protein